jgi:hypothetical protein
MWNPDSHIPIEQLVGFSDGEVSRRQAARIRKHLTACWTCRGRLAKLERTIEDFAVAYGQTATERQTGTPAALLRARLSQIADNSIPVRSGTRRFAYASMLTIAAACVLAAYLGIQRVDAAATPDSQLTPGAVRVADREDVCLGPLKDEFYPISSTLAYKVFEKYGIRNPHPESYEVDYLITPALGGADDIRNLWPQPYETGTWNAHIKDALEDHLHQLVCTGNLDLATAQRDLSTDWIAAYKRYFETTKPLKIHLGFAKDPPWRG